MSTTANRRIYPGADGRPVVTPTRVARISDTATRYNLPERFIRRLADERRVATVKLGKYRLIDLDDLDRLLREGATPAEVTK